MNKIIGFLISQKKSPPHVDVFNAGLQMMYVTHGAYTIHIWGIGDIASCVVNDTYTLSFPVHDSVMDRNVLISFDGDKIIVENDWLGSIPVFYNAKEKIVSTISHFCIKDKKVHSEGLANFCEFGYSVFEQTIFTDVKFMRYYSKLIVSDSVKVEYKADPVLESAFLEKKFDENEVIDLMQKYISDIESKIDGDIVIPTSGGFDSRMLNYLVRDKKRIRSFTYGVSGDQSQSHEVVYAKKISEIYGTQWRQIELNGFHKYIDQWFGIYGCSTHLHGMYHIEFYKNISTGYDLSEATFLSGIIGDAWAEKGKIDDIVDYQDLHKLGYAHGMNLDPQYVCLQNDETIKRKFYREYAAALRDDRVRTVFSMRMKLMLLSYLTQIPEYFGMPVWTPFLNFDIVRATLNIPDERRIDRVWERDFFARVGLDLENMDLRSVKKNKLDYIMAKKAHFEPIDAEKMSAYFDKRRIRNINRILSERSFFEKIRDELCYLPKIGELMQSLRLNNVLRRAMYDYYVIKAIEKSLKL